MYYVNMGRWADNIIGPFETIARAEDYIDRTGWRGARPTVVQIAPPLKRKWKVTIPFSSGDVTYTVEAATDAEARQEAMRHPICGGVRYSFYVKEVTA